MCGIVIVADTGSSPDIDEREVVRMRDAIAHRGPDDATVETVDPWIVLGHRRLSIIDVAGARQPLRSEDGNVVCIFNGEIYNFQSLRSRLVALGHRFQTEGDGEVIVHGYEEWGDDVFARLDGMFAAAVVDRKRRRTLLARDRFGIKPLFYRHSGTTTFAASELKALVPGAGASASRTALRLGAMRMHVPWPLTAFDGIYRLPPGAILELAVGAAPRLRRATPMVFASGPVDTDPDALLEQLRGAVARQMVADVPVGAFLSGGIDSTLIVSLMRQITTSEIHTFSVQTSELDESDVAAATARELGTTHHTLSLDDITFDDLAALPAMYDEPFAETSALGVRALSRAAREHVKVALSGDGGDEVFGGYNSYRWIRDLARIPVPARRSLGRAAHRLLMARPWPATARRLLRAALLFGDDPAGAQRDVTTLSWSSGSSERELSERLSHEILRTSGLDLDSFDATRLGMLADRLERLPNAMLTKVDIASMSASLEVRVPLLDDELVRFADRLPSAALMSFRRGKVPLRTVLARLPGGRVAWDTKRGFSLPLDTWMNRPAVATRFAELFTDHARTLEALTGVDVVSSWRSFQNGTSRFSAGTAAMQLLWFSTVALWADRFRVTTAVDRPLETVPLA